MKFKQNPFPDVDVSQYANWAKVTLPSGEVVYEVPGHMGYVFDPVLSNATGDTVFRVNPKGDIEKQKQLEDEHAQAAKQAAFNSSPAGQILPVAAGTAGTLGSLYAFNAMKPTTVSGVVGNNVIMSDGSVVNAATGQAVTNTAANAAAQGALAVPGDAGFVGPIAPTSAGAVAPAVANTGGILSGLGPTGSEFAGMGSLSQVGLGVGGLYGGYNLINNFGHEKPISGLANGAAAGALAGSVIPGVGTLIGAGIGAGLGGLSSLYHKKTTKELEADRWANTGHAGVEPGHDYFAGTGGEQSRDEKFLTPDAIRNNPDNYNNVPDWDKWSKSQQDQFLSTLLNEGKVQEKKGGIYYDDARAQQLADEIRKNGPGMNVAQTPAQAAAQGAMKPYGRPISVIPQPVPRPIGG